LQFTTRYQSQTQGGGGGGGSREGLGFFFSLLGVLIGKGGLLAQFQKMPGKKTCDAYIFLTVSRYRNWGQTRLVPSRFSCPRYGLWVGFEDFVSSHIPMRKGINKWLLGTSLGPNTGTDEPCD